MSFFLTAPRSHGPSWERIISHIISAWYLTKKLPGPRSQNMIVQNTFGGPRSPLGSYPPRYTTKDQSKHEQRFPRTHQGALEQISGFTSSNFLVFDQESQQYTGALTRVFFHGSNCLVPDQEPQECIGGPRSQLWSLTFSWRIDPAIT
jgi:hypothetical protein